MFKRILVPLDGSARAESALPVAARIARQNGGTIILARAQTVHIDYGLWGVASLSSEALDAEQLACEECLTAAARLPVLAGVTTETRVLVGPPAAALLGAVSEVGADLVVMTSHGRTGLSRWVLGSVARHIAYHSPVPVLVLREQGTLRGSDAPAGSFEPRLLVPLDGSPLAEVAVEPAIALASALAPRASIHLALVLSPYDEVVTCVPELLLAEKADAYLRGVAARIEEQHKNISVTRSVSENFDAAEVLVRCAEHGDHTAGLPPVEPADLVVMATHGRSGIAVWAVGSVTERVLQGTTLPMLIVRAPAKADEVREFIAPAPATAKKKTPAT